jgi:hypothetical protein
MGFHQNMVIVHGNEASKDGDINRRDLMAFTRDSMGSSMGRRKESKQQELLGGLEHDFYMTFPSYWVLLGIMIIGNNDPS